MWQTGIISVRTYNRFRVITNWLIHSVFFQIESIVTHPNLRLFSPFGPVRNPTTLRTVTCHRWTGDTSRISPTTSAPGKTINRVTNPSDQTMCSRQRFTCVPLPEPGGPSRMALMPGNLTSSSGCGFPAVANGGMVVERDEITTTKKKNGLRKLRRSLRLCWTRNEHVGIAPRPVVVVQQFSKHVRKKKRLTNQPVSQITVLAVITAKEGLDKVEQHKKNKKNICKHYKTPIFIYFFLTF